MGGDFISNCITFKLYDIEPSASSNINGASSSSKFSQYNQKRLNYNSNQNGNYSTSNQVNILKRKKEPFSKQILAYEYTSLIEPKHR